MASNPLVSIIMAVRDGAPYLRATLDSLLAQTYSFYELVVVDDGSADATAAILDGWPDSRIVRLAHPQTQGLAASLNHGLGVAKGGYIARMDADDLARPDRLSRQVVELESRRDIAILGSAYDLIDEGGGFLETQRQPLGDGDIRWQMLFHNAFCHSSVMLRRQAVEAAGGYDSSLAFAQDYDLWSRLLKQGKAANLGDPLISLRQHSSSMSALAKAQQQSIATRISTRNIEAQLGKSVCESDVAHLRAWYYGLPERLPDGASSSLALLQELLRQAGPRWAKIGWAERIALHPNMTLGAILPFLAAAPIHAGARALLKRLFGGVACRPDRVRDL